jgi:PAS domain S-box-containing protein
MKILEHELQALKKYPHHLKPRNRALATFGMVFLAILLQYIFRSFIDEAVYLFLYPCVFIITWLLGVIPGIFALVSFGLMSLGHAYSQQDYVSSSELFRLFVYVLSSSLVIFIIHRGHGADEKLEESYHWFRTALRSIGDAVLIVDLRGIILFMNPVAEVITGWSSVDAHHRPLHDVLKLFHDKDGQAMTVPLGEIIQTNSPYELSGGRHLQSKTGRFVPIEDSAAPLRTGESTIGVVIVFRDISDKYQTQERLKQNEKLLRLATEASKVGVWDYHIPTGDIFRNDLHDQIFGHSMPLRSWTINDFYSHLHPDDRQRTEEILNQSIKNKTDYRNEFRVVWPDGSIHWILASARMDSQESGDRLIGTFIDITSKKEAEETLQEALFYRDEFLSIASHELKTPLTSLKLQSQVFKRMLSKNDPEVFERDRVERLIEQVDRQVTRLVRLVDDMLDISRIRTGMLSISKEDVRLEELVKEVAERIRPQYAEAQVEGPIIDSLVPFSMACDRLRLEQVLSNLLNNALRYGEKKPVHVQMVTVPQGIEILVKDQGIGISEENIEKIFSRFQRAVPASEVSGLGLGLYIAKQIVEAHHGKITVESELGKGSTFKLFLPKTHA